MVIKKCSRGKVRYFRISETSTNEVVIFTYYINSFCVYQQDAFNRPGT